MRPPLQSASFRFILVLAIFIVVLPSSIATAGPILLNFDVRLTSTALAIDETDSDIAVGGGVEIAPGSGNVGDEFFSDESIDVTNTATWTSLAYLIKGGGDLYPTANYRYSWPAETTLRFSNFDLDQPGTLSSVNLIINQAQVIGVDYEFGLDYLQIDLDSLGVSEQAPNQLGLMTFRLNFMANDPLPPNPVADPASSLTLFGMAMAALAARRRFERRRH